MWMELLGILLIAAVAWLWLDSLKARETAVRAAREACRAEGLQLLDDTVAISSLWPARDPDGRLRLYAEYAPRVVQVLTFPDPGRDHKPSNAEATFGDAAPKARAPASTWESC